MPQQINVPGMGVVNFPDGMTDDQISAAIRANSGQAAPEETNLLKEGAKVVGSSLYGGTTAIPRLVMQGGDWLEQRFPSPDVLKFQIPGYEEMSGADAAIRQAIKPDTGWGQSAANVGESAVGALVSPGGFAAPLKSLAIGTGAGVGAEGAAKLFGDNALVRLLGGLAGGGATGLLSAAKTNRTKLAQEALSDVKPQDLKLAVQRMQQAEAAGIPINLSQAMPRASNIDAYVNTLANSKHGKQITEMLRNQPQQIGLGVEDQMHNLPGSIRAPQVLANEAQEVASEAIKQKMQLATKEWMAAAPKGATIPEAGMKYFDEMLDAMSQRYAKSTSEHQIFREVRNAIKKADNVETGGSPILDAGGKQINPPTKGPQYYTDAIMVKGAIDDALHNFGARNLNTPGLQGKELRRAQEIRELFSKEGGLLEHYAPDLVKANRAYESVMKGQVAPMKKSVVGRLAGRAGAQDVLESPQTKLTSVFDKGTVPGAKSSEILTMEKAFREAGSPEVYQDAAKSWIATKVSNALKTQDNRMPDDIGARLRSIFGDPRQADTTSKGFEDILAGMARSQGLGKDEAAYVKGFKHFMEIVSDASRRPASVSGTTAGEVRNMASDGLFRRLGQVSVMTPIRQPALKWASFLESDALGKMDQLLTSPEGVATLVKLGKQPRFSHSAVATMATFLGTAANAEHGGDNIPDITAE